MLGVVVLAIASELIAMWDRAWARGREVQCEQHLHEVGFGLLGYLNSHSAFPPGTWPNPDLAPEDRISLWGPVSPYLDQQLWFDVAQSEAWNHAGINDEVSRHCVYASACSEATRPVTGKLQPMSYIAIAGVGADAPLVLKSDPCAGVFGYNRQTTLADIKDGAATTMMIAETAQVSGSWFQGGPATVRGLDQAQQPYIGPARQFGGLHSGGAYIVMADGSVRWISDSITRKAFESLSTIAGGEK